MMENINMSLICAYSVADRGGNNIARQRTVDHTHTHGHTQSNRSSRYYLSTGVALLTWAQCVAGITSDACTDPSASSSSSGIQPGQHQRQGHSAHKREDKTGKKSTKGTNGHRTQQMDKPRKDKRAQPASCDPKRKGNAKIWNLLHWNLTGAERFLGNTEWKEYISKFHVVCLNETHSKPSEGIKTIEGFQHISCPRSDDAGGVSMLIRNDVYGHFDVNSIQSKGDRIWVRTNMTGAENSSSNKFPLSIGSVYLPPTGPGWNLLTDVWNMCPLKRLMDELLEKNKTDDVLMLSDTNAYTKNFLGTEHTEDDWNDPYEAIEGDSRPYRITECTHKKNARGNELPPDTANRRNDDP